MSEELWTCGYCGLPIDVPKGVALTEAGRFHPRCFLLLPREDDEPADVRLYSRGIMSAVRDRALRVIRGPGPHISSRRTPW